MGRMQPFIAKRLDASLRRLACFYPSTRVNGCFVTTYPASLKLSANASIRLAALLSRSAICSSIVRP